VHHEPARFVFDWGSVSTGHGGAVVVTAVAAGAAVAAVVAVGPLKHFAN